MSSAYTGFSHASSAAVPWSRSLSGSSDIIDSNQTSLWRPWLSSIRNRRDQCPQSEPSDHYSRPTVPGCVFTDGKPQSFQHPVRLFWPKSKSFDYLYSDGETLLRNFPIQATISFYNDSEYEDDDNDDDDEEEEDWEQDGHSEVCLK